MSSPVLLLMVPEAVFHGVWRDGGHIQHSMGGGTGLCVGTDSGGRTQGSKVSTVVVTVF